jgi:hypothetical protein
MDTGDFMILNPLNQEKFSPEAVELCDELNAEITRLNERRAAFSRNNFNQATDSASAAPRGSRSADHARGRVSSLMAQSLNRRDELASMLEEEIRIRERLEGEWYPLRARERSRVRDEAHKHSAATEADIRKRLVSIGYIDIGIPGAIGGITNDMVARHPAVLQVRAKAREAFDFLHDNHDVRENEIALGQVRQRLEGMLQRVMAI